MYRLVKIVYRPLPPLLRVRCYSASPPDHGKSEDNKPEETTERQPDFYRPGSDSFAYENPWPKLNKGRLDWMFQDGWRRPLAKDQGGKMRREWLWFGQKSFDEYEDWYKFHMLSFVVMTATVVWLMSTFFFFNPDFPFAKEWALRGREHRYIGASSYTLIASHPSILEAHLEMARREKAGLPHISKDLIDPERVAAVLPSEQELRDIEIII